MEQDFDKINFNLDRSDMYGAIASFPEQID